MCDVKGRCLCGETVFTAKAKNNDVHACHCSMCRRQGSGPFMSVDIDPQSMQFFQGDFLKTYSSSELGERGFCSNCGTVLFWRTKDQVSYAAANVFVLDIPQDKLNFVTEIYIDSKPAFYAFKNETEQLTEADILAMFNADKK